MLFKKLIVPMTKDYATSNCSKLVFYKTDIKDIIFDEFNLKIVLNNNLSYNIPSSSPRIMFEGIIVQSHIGTWYSIDHKVYGNKMYFLLEHEEYGDETSNIIIDHDGKLIADNVFNGFDDLDDYFDDLKRESKRKEDENTIHIVVQNGLIEAVYAANKELNVSIIDLDTLNSSLKSYLNDEVETLKANKYDILK